MSSWVFLLLLFRTAVTEHNAYYTSSCDKDTDWNRKDVDKALKTWIDSIKVNPNKKSTDMSIAFYDDNNTRLEFIGHVDREGYADGRFWVSMAYGDTNSYTNGFLYGHLDVNGKMTGSDIAFVYPDMLTVMYGNFSDSVMIGARQSKITAERCKRNMKEIKVRKPKSDAPLLKYEVSTEFRFSGPMTVGDPYERRTVYLKDIPGKGEGLFAKRDIANGEHIAYYAGFIQNITERPMFYDNQTEEDMFVVHKNLIILDNDMHMNMPLEYWELYQYRATLAHKTNHAFNNTNSVFNSPFHPRYGVIRGVEATKDIKRGEEILVNYGYGLDSLNPKWYYDAYMKEVGELPPDELKKYEEKYGPLEKKK